MIGVRSIRTSEGPVAGRLALAAATGLLFLTATLPEALEAQLAVRGGTIHTMEGDPIRDGVVLIGADGRIQAVGPAASTPIPAGWRTLEAAVVTPGLVDGRSVVGLAGYLNQPHDQDQLETSSAIQPELRAVDAYNPRETLVDYVRSLGVTTLHTGHGPGALMSGQTMVVKTRGTSVEEATLIPVTAIAMTLGPEVGANFSGNPGTRARGMAMVRAEFLKAQEALPQLRADGTLSPRNLRTEILARALRGDVQVMITAQRATEILGALRLQREFGFPLILDGAAESYQVMDAIREADVPVILHPTMARHAGTLENATLETARLLREAGIPVALQSGFEAYVPKTRVILFEAAMAAAYGLPFDEALRTITLAPAQILRIADRVGSLAPGKDGDLVLFNGDPFEYLTLVCGVVIDGQITDQDPACGG
jgi:imidazolonepropionase-like amidohydrolase